MLNTINKAAKKSIILLVYIKRANTVDQAVSSCAVQRRLHERCIAEPCAGDLAVCPFKAVNFRENAVLKSERQELTFEHRRSL